MHFRALHPWIVSCLLTASLSVASARAQSVLYVDDSATGANDGSSWCDAFVYLQDALAAAEASGGTVTEIRVAQGTYKPDQGANQTPGDRTASFNLVNGVAHRGGYAGCGAPDPNIRDNEVYETIISGDLLADDPIAGSTCCYPHARRACDDETCSITVCAVDPGCCNGMWNDTCAFYAQNLCAGTCGNNADNSIRLLIADGLALPTLIEGLIVTLGRAEGAFAEGAGLWSRLSHLQVHDCQFALNTALGPTARGAATFFDSGTIAISNCVFRRNAASSAGGAIAVIDSALTISGSAFLENSVLNIGGAIAVGQNSPTTISNSVFISNDAGSGGALSAGSAGVTINDSTFAAGLAVGGGGAVYLNYSDLNVATTTFVGNVGSEGGAISAGSCCGPGKRIDLASAAFVANRSHNGNGGAINIFAEVILDARNSAFVANSASGTGAGVISGFSSPMNLFNSLFWFNVDSSGAGELAAIRSTQQPAAIGYCSVQQWTGALGGLGNSGADPLFLGGPTGIWTEGAEYDEQYGVTIFTDAAASWPPGVWVGRFLSPATSQNIQTYIVGSTATSVTVLGDFAALGLAGGTYKINDYRLSSGSPCIDAADNTAVPADTFDLDNDGNTTEPLPFDLDGNPRFKDDPATSDTGVGTPPLVDMGAYEYQRGCLVSADCDNADPCDGVETCVSNVCEPGTPIICDDGEPCNGTESCDANGSCATSFDADCNANQIEDACDITNGAPDNNGNGVPDECELGACCTSGGTCSEALLASCGSGSWSVGLDCDPNPCAFLTSAAPTGCRYVAVTPNPNGNPSTPIAVKVTSSGLPCITKYVAIDSGIGRLTDFPSYAPPGMWGEVAVADSELIPGLAYDIRVQTATAMSDPVTVTLRRWGDVVEPWEQVSFVDISAAVSCFRHVPGAPPLSACDLAPAVPDQVVDFVDIAATVSAFQGVPYPFPSPCP